MTQGYPQWPGSRQGIVGPWCISNRGVYQTTTKCGKGCPAYPYIKEGKGDKINNKEWKINKSYDCNSYNVVYAVICKKEKCKKAY